MYLKEYHPINIKTFISCFPIIGSNTGIKELICPNQIGELKILQEKVTTCLSQFSKINDVPMDLPIDSQVNVGALLLYDTAQTNNADH